MTDLRLVRNDKSYEMDTAVEREGGSGHASERVSALEEQLRQAPPPPRKDSESTSNPSRPSFCYEFGVVAEAARSLAGGYLSH